MTTLSCIVTGKPFEVAPREAELLRQLDLPLPRKAPFERWIYAVGQSTPFAFRKVICPVTETPILTRWSERGAISGVSPEWFWSDECDNSDAGVDYDFSRPFFEQFEELARRCYAPSVNRVNCDNSPYVNACVGLKDCHLCFACEYLRDCFYCALCSRSTDLVFCSGLINSELCYRCLDCEGIYGSRFLQDCKNCRDCYWCIDCIGCSNCFQCVGLRQASDGYYIRNEKVSKEEWTQTIRAIDFGSFAAETRIDNAAKEFFQDRRVYNTNFNNEGCSLIYHVDHCKNCENAMYSQNCEDSKDVVFTSNAKDCYSMVWGRNVERCYQVVGGSEAYDCAFCDGVIGNARKQMYCFCCYNGSNNLFGCFFLKTKDHCILNKQYSPAEYSAMLPRIKRHMQSTGEWGEWFPPSFYAVPYDESWARYFLTELTEEQILRRGLVATVGESKTEEAIGMELPDTIDDFTDELCGKQIACALTGQRYSIGLQELKALRKQTCPIPRLRWSSLLTALQTVSMERCHRELGME